MKKTSVKICAILLIVSLMTGMLVTGVSATGTNGARIVSQQLSLGDDLTMRFAVAVDSQYVDTATVSATVNGNTKTQNIKGITPNEEGNYLICVDLAAAQMTDEITVSVANGETVLTEGTYSVRGYAEYLLEGNYTDATKQMVKEVLNYGAKAQAYFDHNVNDLANAGYEIESTAEVPSVSDLEMVTGQADGITYYGATLVFTSKIALRFYFTANGDISTYTFSTGSEPVEKSSGLYYVEVDDINPQDYGSVIALTVNDTLTVNYSPLTYITRMYAKESASTELKNLMQAMYSYYLAADAFVGIEENAPVDTREEVKATVTTGWLLGTWVSQGDITKAYDGSTGTKWNPQSSGYKSGEGVAFQLDAAYDLTKIDITFSKNDMYFDAYVSDTGETYTLIASVTAENKDTYYKDGSATCTIDGLETLASKYIKLNFTGREGNSAWVNFFEIEAYGKLAVVEEEIDTREEVKATVSAGELVGPWKVAGAVANAFDGNSGTQWNPQSIGYESGEAVVFHLDGSYDLTKIAFTYGNKYHYFKILVSSDNQTFTEIAAVDADSQYDSAYVCTADGLKAQDVKYVKILFTGTSSGSAYVNLYEVEIYGKADV